MDTNSEDSRPHKRLKVAEDSSSLQNNVKSVTNSDDNMKEIEVGINTWIDGSRPVFHGILKKRYTDFLVNEVLLDGTVAHLHSLSVKQSADANVAAATTAPGGPDRDGEIRRKAPESDQIAENIPKSDPVEPVKQVEMKSKSGGAEVSIHRVTVQSLLLT